MKTEPTPLQPLFYALFGDRNTMKRYFCWDSSTSTEDHDEYDWCELRFWWHAQLRGKPHLEKVLQSLFSLAMLPFWIVKQTFLFFFFECICTGMILILTELLFYPRLRRSHRQWITTTERVRGVRPAFIGQYGKGYGQLYFLHQRQLFSADPSLMSRDTDVANTEEEQWEITTIPLRVSKCRAEVRVHRADRIERDFIEEWRHCFHQQTSIRVLRVLLGVLNVGGWATLAWVLPVFLGGSWLWILWAPFVVTGPFLYLPMI